MVRYIDAIDLPIPVEAAFDLLADFSRTVEWDPGVIAAQRLDDGEPRRGSRFRVIVSFLGRKLPLEYRITALERPSRVVLRGGNGSLVSIDEITLAPREGGTRVTYEARLELAGAAKLAEPLLQRLFQSVGRKAARGLRERASRGDLRKTRTAEAPSLRKSA